MVLAPLPSAAEAGRIGRVWHRVLFGPTSIDEGREALSTTPPQEPWGQPSEVGGEPSSGDRPDSAPPSPGNYPPPPPPPGNYPPPPGGYTPPGSNYPPPPPGNYPPYPQGNYPPPPTSWSQPGWQQPGPTWNGPSDAAGGYLAGWWRRVAATIIDGVLVGVVLSIILVAANVPTAGGR